MYAPAEKRSKYIYLAKSKLKRSDSVLRENPLHKRTTKQTSDNTKTAYKFSNTQRLRTDLERSVEVNNAIRMVWLNLFAEFQPSH